MKFLKRNEGIATIWAAITMLVLVSFMGLAVDMGLMVWNAQQLQIAADGAALAGAQFVRSDPVRARDQAQLVGVSNRAAGVTVQLQRNDGNAPGGDIVFGRFDRDAGTFDPAGTPNSVQVNARRTAGSLNGALQTVFARVMGMNALDMQRSAIAIVGGGTGSGMLVLDNNARCALTIRGNPTVNVFDGAIQVNSANSCGTCIQGDPVVEATEINAVGGICLTGTPDELPDLNENQPPIPDPLETLPDPSYTTVPDRGIIDKQAGSPFSPGYYSGGIDLSGGDIVLNPGIYILNGKGIEINGSANFTADGCMFFIIGTGDVNIGGTGDIKITPPDPDLYSYPGVDTFEGIAMFQSRTNTNEGRIVGTGGNLDLQGTYYFPKNKMNFGGSGYQAGAQLIAWELEIYGSGQMDLAVNGLIPAPGRRVFLVR